MAQTPKEQQQALFQQSLAYQREMRKKLERIVQPGKSKNWNQRRKGEFTENYRNAVGEMGGLTWKFGQEITDADVQKFIAHSGGNPYAKKLKEIQVTTRNEPSTPSRFSRMRSVEKEAAKAEKSLIEQLADEYKRANEEAKAANLARYDEGHGELSGLRTRNSDRVKNYGIAAKGDLEDRFSENLAEVTAGLSGRGLGNSTITSAFEAKNARDLAREQQRLSEMVDDRASRYDTQDTGNLVGFVERRNDIAPDMGGLTELAMRYGASGAGGLPGQGGGGQGVNQSAGPTWNLPYAMGPYGATRVAQSVQGTYPSLGQMMNPVTSLGPNVSNRGVQVREKYEPTPALKTGWSLEDILGRARKPQLTDSPMNVPLMLRGVRKPKSVIPRTLNDAEYFAQEL
jgi:hypothetical protein